MRKAPEGALKALSAQTQIMNVIFTVIVIVVQQVGNSGTEIHSSDSNTFGEFTYNPREDAAIGDPGRNFASPV